MAQVSGLLEKMSAQQAASAQTVERMQAASAEGAETIARKLEASGADLVRNVLGASRAEVEAMAGEFRSMTDQVGAETRQRGEEATQMTQAVMAQVSGLLEKMSAQQAASTQAIERMQAASAQGAETMARKLESSGVGLVSSVLGASRTEIEAIVGTMREAAKASATRYEDIEARAAAAAAAVGQASEGLVRSANAVIEVANQTSALVAQTRTGSEAIQGAAREFQQAGNTLLGSLGQMEKVIEATRLQTGEQQQLLLRQREYTKEVEKLWPQLFDTYLTQFKAGADELGRSWEGFHQKIAEVAGTIGGEFAENTSILSEAVDRLAKHTIANQVAR